MSGGMTSFGQGVATLMIGGGLNGYYQFVGQFFDHQRKIGVNFLGIRFFFSKILKENYWRQSAPFINSFRFDKQQV